MSEYQKGIGYAAFSYVLWGLLPIYWALIKNITAYELLAHRILWSFVFMVLLITLLGKYQLFIQQTKQLLMNKKATLSLICAAILITINWGLFIWAVTNEHVLQASLGYYINPLMSVFLGLIFMKERFSIAEWSAIALAIVGVLFMTLSIGVTPYISISLALSFALYGLIKKNVKMDALYTILLECLITLPFALIYILYLAFTHSAQFGMNTSSAWLLLSGALTAIPLIAFTAGAKRIPLSLVGFIQYIGPTLMFIIGVFMFHEEFTTTHLITFSFIWLGVLIFSLAKYMQYKKYKSAIK